MPVERKPLFRAEILAPRAAALALGPEAEQARDVLRKWARLLGSARAEELTESELLPDFLTDIYKVLGYRGPTASGERYTLSRGKKLADLDHSIRAGNSLVNDPELDPRNAFDWQGAFPEAFADGGFDVVVENPPYVRQRRLGALKRQTAPPRMPIANPAINPAE